MKASSGPKENGLEVPLDLSHGGLWPLPLPWRPGLPGRGCPDLKARQGQGGCPGDRRGPVFTGPSRDRRRRLHFFGPFLRRRRKEEVGGERGGVGGGGKGRAERGFGKREEVRRARRRWEPAGPATGGESGAATRRPRPSPAREPRGLPSGACPPWQQTKGHF